MKKPVTPDEIADAMTPAPHTVNVKQAAAAVDVTIHLPGRQAQMNDTWEREVEFKFDAEEAVAMLGGRPARGDLSEVLDMVERTLTAGFHIRSGSILHRKVTVLVKRDRGDTPAVEREEGT